MNILLGYCADGGPIEVSEEQLAHHLYMLGRSGMGKTTCLCNICLALMDVNPKVGLCVIDPLGALVEVMKRRIPDHRRRDVVLFEARDRKHPFALNPFAPKPPEDMLGQWASHVMSVFQLMCEDGEWNSRTKQTLRNIIITLVSRNTKGGPLGEDWPAALDEVSPILTLQAEDDGDRPRWRQTVTPYRSIFYSTLEEAGHIPVLRFWRDLYDKVMTLRPKAEVSAAIGGNTDQHMANPIVRNTVGQTQTKINFLDVMNEGKILLVDLSGVGDDSANFLGSVIMAQLASATLQREAYAEPHFYIVADELYRYGNEAFRYISRQGRNFNVHLIAAQQDQTDMRPWQRGLMGNASNRVYFQLVPSDALEQAHEFDATPPSTKVMEPIYQPMSVDSATWVACVGVIERLERYKKALQSWQRYGGQGLMTGAVTEEDVRTFSAWALDASEVPLLHMGPGDSECDVVVAGHLCKATTQGAREWAKSSYLDECHYDGFLVTPELAGGERLGGLDAWMSANRPPEAALETTERAIERVKWYMNELAGGEGVFVHSPDEDRRVPVARTVAWDWDGQPYQYVDAARVRGIGVYYEVERQQRTHADVEREIANELTHLPRRYAKCKLVGLGDAPPTEATIKTAPLGAENPRWRENWTVVKKRSRKNYTRPVDEVEEEARRRDRIMRRALETWHSGDGGSREYHGDEPSLQARGGGLRVQR
jgi:hypothetical protein